MRGARVEAGRGEAHAEGADCDGAVLQQLPARVYIQSALEDALRLAEVDRYLPFALEDGVLRPAEAQRAPGENIAVNGDVLALAPVYIALNARAADHRQPLALRRDELRVYLAVCAAGRLVDDYHQLALAV